MRRFADLRAVAAGAAAVLVLSVFIPAAPAPGASGPPPQSAAPAAGLAAARGRLDALKSYRERRDYELPRRAAQIVEFSGGLQHWIMLDALGGVENEVIWDGGRSASRKAPGAAWVCNPPLPDEATEPPAVVRDGGALVVNGRSANRFVEEFNNPLVGSRVVHEVDVDAATGLPIRLISTETEGGFVTRYVGTYYDLGAPIALALPRCR